MADIENLRYEAGKDARQKGESLHETASEDFKKGYHKGSRIGSNVMPKKFGKGGDSRSSWYCVCSFENKAFMTAKRAGELVCWLCGTPKSYGEDKEHEQGNSNNGKAQDRKVEIGKSV